MPVQSNGPGPPVPFDHSMFGDYKVQKQQHQGDNNRISFPRSDRLESGVELLTETRTQADIENRNILEDQRPPRMNTIVMDATDSSDVAHPSGDGDGATNTTSPRGLHQDGFILKIPEAYLVERQDSKDNDNCKIIVRLIWTHRFLSTNRNASYISCPS